jgi:hypothetical protein
MMIEKKGLLRLNELSLSFNTLLKRSSSHTPQMVEKVFSLFDMSARSTISKPLPLKKAFMLSKYPNPP